MRGSEPPPLSSFFPSLEVRGVERLDEEDWAVEEKTDDQGSSKPGSPGSK